MNHCFPIKINNKIFSKKTTGFVFVNLLFVVNGLLSTEVSEKDYDQETQFQFGNRYHYGIGVLKDYKQAFLWYKRSAEQGHPEAQNRLGFCYHNHGYGVEQDLEQAFLWYKRSAEQGFPEGQFNLGTCYIYGTGIEKDRKRASSWYKRSAQQGNAKAQRVLGIHYGVEQDLEQAFLWIKKSAEQGFPPGQNSLGLRYYLGIGVVKDYKQSFAWYKKSAEQGNAWAQNKVADFYKHGKGVEKNLQKAIRWYTKSAEQGCSNAKSSLGMCYKNGEGVSKSLVLAHMWINLSARGKETEEILEDLEKKMTEEQIEDAQNRVKDWKEKNFIANLKKHIQQGDRDPRAKYSLGMCYKNGEGVPKSLVLAHMWIYLSELNIKFLKRLEKKMTEEQIEDAQNRAKDWKEKESFASTKKSAQHGDPWSQYSLGLYYKKGIGVSKSPTLAYMWIHLSGLMPQELKELEEIITKEQIEEALNRASQWKDNKEKVDVV